MKEGTDPARGRVEPGSVTTMSASRQSGSDDGKSLWLLAGTLVLSIVAHVTTIVVLPGSVEKK